MRLAFVAGVIMCALEPVFALETTLERRVHRHKHSKVMKDKPLESLSELMTRSAELTKAFEKESADLHSQVQESEEMDTEGSDVVSSFIETNHPSRPSGLGLRAMESVTNEIMQFTDKMRKMGNDVSLFATR